MNTLVRRLLTITALVGVVVITSISLSAQGRGGGPPAAAKPPGPVPRTADGKPDLRGVWSGAGRVGFTHSALIEEHEGGFGIAAGRSLIIDPKDGKIPYKPAALEERDRRRDDVNAYEDRASHCEAYGSARLHQFTHDIQYVGDLIIIESGTPTRQARIFDLKKTKHLPDTYRFWMGDSIAKWEGDTLVIETTNFNGKTWMGFGDYHGPNAVLVERWTMTDSDTIKWTQTITDPETFTQPWTMDSAFPLARRPNLTAADRDNEDDCNEGNVQVRHLRNTYEKAHGLVVPKPLATWR